MFYIRFVSVNNAHLMRLMINKLLSVCTRVVLLVFVSVVPALAQAPPPGSNPPGAPIDGLVTLLLAVSVGYGVYRSRNEAAR